MASTFHRCTTSSCKAWIMLKHQFKNVLLSAYGQLMADGMWGGRCLATVNKGHEVQERILTTPLVYNTEHEASEAGLEFGKECYLASSPPIRCSIKLKPTAQPPSSPSTCCSDARSLPPSCPSVSTVCGCPLPRATSPKWHRCA